MAAADSDDFVHLFGAYEFNKAATDAGIKPYA